MVAGGEKLYVPEKWEIFYSEMASVDHDWDGAQGLGLPPPAFAMVAKQHMKQQDNQGQLHWFPSRTGETG
jgi:acetyl-CoA C-acetyltransferase